MTPFVLSYTVDTEPGHPPVNAYDPILDKLHNKKGIVAGSLSYALLNFKANDAANAFFASTAVQNLLIAEQRVKRFDAMSFAFIKHLETSSEQVRPMDVAAADALHAIATAASARYCEYSSRWTAYSLDTTIRFVAEHRRIRETGEVAGPAFAQAVRDRIALMIALYECGYPMVDFNEVTR